MASRSGEWKLVNGGTAAVGTEKWKLEETSSSFDYSSMIVRKTPFPHREELRVKATMRSWELQDIEISAVADSPSGHPFERFSGNKRNGSFEVESSRGGILERASVPVSDSTEFDYLSPIFNTITFHRLRLRRRQTREIEAFFIFPVLESGSFRTKMVPQRYERLHDVPLSTPVGTFPMAKHYVYRNLDTGWTGSIWTDNMETVLRYEKFCELLSYSQTG